MKILISVKNKIVKVFLKKGLKNINFLEIKDEYQLSDDLLPTIEKLIQKNSLSSKDIKKIEVKSDQKDSFTTTRIAKAVAKTWNSAKKFDNF